MPLTPRVFTSLSCVLSVLTFSAVAFALEPPPGGGYPNNITALGTDALFDGNPGEDNTAIGFETLYNCTSAGVANTAVGWEALLDNTGGGGNTAVGWQAALGNNTGSSNVAIGT